MSGKKNKDDNLPGFDTQILQAETRTEQAETRTEQAETRTEQAKTRIEQAEMRTEAAEMRTEAAKTRTEQAESRTEAAEMRSVLAIHTSELGYRRLFETAPDGILILDADTGQVVDANPFMKDLLGYSQEEFLGKKLWEIGPFKGEAASKITFAELQHKDRIRYEGLPLETKDGQRVEVEFISIAYLVDLKRLIQCNIRSITERKQANEALRSSELSYRRLFEAAQDGVLILEANTGRITDVNPFLIKLLGFSHDEMMGKTVGELSPFKDMESNKIMLERLKKDGYVRYEDLPLETLDGRHIAVEFVCNVYEAGGHDVIQCNIRDITEQKQAENEIHRLNVELEQRVVERTAELEMANQELEAFSYSVSHDLRAPLRHVMGFVELLQKDAGPSLSEKNLGYLKTISQSAKRMGDLIDDLLDFSRVGQAKIQKTEVNLDELVREALGDFQAEMKNRKIIFDLLPLPLVRADRALLRMVLVNLISNAVKFTGKCAEAKIEIGPVPNGNGATEIFIRDNGVGFDPQYAGKLFGVFQRLHSNAEFEGTGIGLANVQRIILRHGGRVWAEGKVDGGATFYFSLPE